MVGISMGRHSRDALSHGPGAYSNHGWYHGRARGWHGFRSCDSIAIDWGRVRLRSRVGHGSASYRSNHCASLIGLFVAHAQRPSCRYTATSWVRKSEASMYWIPAPCHGKGQPLHPASHAVLATLNDEVVLAAGPSCSRLSTAYCEAKRNPRDTHAIGRVTGVFGDVALSRCGCHVFARRARPCGNRD